MSASKPNPQNDIFRPCSRSDVFHNVLLLELPDYVCVVSVSSVSLPETTCILPLATSVIANIALFVVGSKRLSVYEDGVGDSIGLHCESIWLCKYYFQRA